MDPTPEQVTAFGAELRRLRRNAGITSVQRVAALLTEQLQRDVKHQSVSAWERGQYAPQERVVVECLDELVGADGALLAILYGPTALSERVARLEAWQSRVDRQLNEILRRLPPRKGARG